MDGDGSVKVRVGYADKWLETRQDVSLMRLIQFDDLLFVLLVDRSSQNGRAFAYSNSQEPHETLWLDINHNLSGSFQFRSRAPLVVTVPFRIVRRVTGHRPLWRRRNWYSHGSYCPWPAVTKHSLRTQAWECPAEILVRRNLARITHHTGLCRS